jgi:hypothetical protein
VQVTFKIARKRTLISAQLIEVILLRQHPLNGSAQSIEVMEPGIWLQPLSRVFLISVAIGLKRQPRN